MAVTEKMISHSFHHRALISGSQTSDHNRDQGRNCCARRVRRGRNISREGQRLKRCQLSHDWSFGNQWCTLLKIQIGISKTVANLIEAEKPSKTAESASLKPAHCVGLLNISNNAASAG